MTTAARPASPDLIHAPMPTRQLGSTGWAASRLTIGGVKWHDQIPEADAVALLQRAMELGVNTFDTAAGYGNGKSEQRLGLALEGRRDDVFLCTKTGKRGRDEAREEMERSLKNLRTDRVDLWYVHGVDNDEDAKRILDDHSVLRTMEEFRDAGHLRFIGVSGHWYRHNMLKVIEQYPFDAVLMPAGLFNKAYAYDFTQDVVPAARQRNMAVLGMKVMGAGRAKHAKSIEPYLRYSLGQDIDTAVIGCDSLAQLEELVGIVKREPDPLSDAEQQALFDEARAVTQSWDRGEFNWVRHYVDQAK